MTNDTLRPNECLACGSASLEGRVEDQSFDYGNGKSAATLQARVPMYRCRDCDFDFMAADGMAAREEAVRRHLRVLAPKDVVQIRRKWNLSRAAFAELTGIGVASLARWETGQLIQNASADRLLRLCLIAENIERLRIIVSPDYPQSAPTAAIVAQGKFKTIDAGNAQLLNAASQFKLRTPASLNAIPA
jgi:putative zinc finger/helix-turn-helix YgiT family protein